MNESASTSHEKRIDGTKRDPDVVNVDSEQSATDRARDFPRCGFRNESDARIEQNYYLEGRLDTKSLEETTLQEREDCKREQV